MAADDQSGQEAQPREEDEVEAAELLLFQTNECYVYMIPPRKSAASYRADEWNVNKWAWQGALRVISKGEECMIKLEDKDTGELYAQAYVRRGQPLPVEPVIDSSRYFALCIEENFDGRTRHAFIGIGFRERPEAYDFQAALYDHIKYLNKKQAAEEMEQQYQTSSSVDYSLKEGQTIKLQLKTPHKGVGTRKIEQEFDNLLLSETREKINSLPCLAPPPPPPAPSSPSASCNVSDKTVMPEKPSSPSSAGQIKFEVSSTIDDGVKDGIADKTCKKDQEFYEDDFGDFQTAG